MYYEDEKTLIKADIILFIFSFIFIYSMYRCYCEFSNDDYGIEVFILCEVAFLLAAFITSFISVRNILNSNYNRRIAKNIKAKGTMVPGTIKKIETVYRRKHKNSIFKPSSFSRGKVINNGSEDRYIQYYEYAIIEYIYNGNVCTCSTPYIEFDTRYLRDNSVDVYIWDNKCYVDNYKLDVETINANVKNLKKRDAIIILLFFVAFILFALDIYLNFLNIIDEKTMVLLFKICAISYITIAIYISIKFKK